jgi:hypothetical protein
VKYGTAGMIAAEDYKGRGTKNCKMYMHLFEPDRFQTTGWQVDLPKVGFPPEASFNGQRKFASLPVGQGDGQRWQT